MTGTKPVLGRIVLIVPNTRPKACTRAMSSAERPVADGEGMPASERAFIVLLEARTTGMTLDKRRWRRRSMTEQAILTRSAVSSILQSIGFELDCGKNL